MIPIHGVCIAVLLSMQVTKMQDLLKRGIAVHHSGILPLIKEV